MGMNSSIRSRAGGGNFGGGASSLSAISPRNGIQNKHRLSKDIQQYQDYDQEDILDHMQERFENMMRDKKVKESIMKKEK